MMRVDFLSRTLRETRVLKSRSQEFMALELGLARKTVQNWEKGVSVPSIAQALQWFRVLEVSPLPYLFQYVYPEMEGLSAEDEDHKLREALHMLVDEIPVEGMRQLLYLFYGDHGSSPRAVMNMVTAHLQTPMHDRVTAGSVILKNYEMAKKRGQLTADDHVQPDTSLLSEAIKKGEQAAVSGLDTYV